MSPIASSVALQSKALVFCDDDVSCVFQARPVGDFRWVVEIPRSKRCMCRFGADVGVDAHYWHWHWYCQMVFVGIWMQVQGCTRLALRRGAFQVTEGSTRPATGSRPHAGTTLTTCDRHRTCAKRESEQAHASTTTSKVAGQRTKAPSCTLWAWEQRSIDRPRRAYWYVCVVG